MVVQEIKTDILIIGGGTAGCYAAIWLGEHTELTAAIVDKADIKRSGCLAAGVNALNAYITKGHVPQEYVDYAAWDAEGIVRYDLLLDLAESVNDVTHDLEKRGLTILKDEKGNYVSRGWRNLKINGENIKPILAKEVKKQKNVSIYQHINVTDLLTEKGVVKGAVGFGITEDTAYVFTAKAVLVATGGASGLYRPNNPETMPHQMWYSPFNTGAGYAMGILAGAEMTTFEMRFIALRCKDTIAPTGTIAQGVGAPQVNARGENYESKFGITTSGRLWGTVMENREGRGPCFLKTEGIDEETEQSLYKAYLNMAPLQTLKWLESGQGPATQNVEVEGTEPYIVGGHTASGYWVGRDRQTTVKGLFAAGDVAGGAPQKYVTGALAEGAIAAAGIAAYLEEETASHNDKEDPAGSKEILSSYERFLQGEATNTLTPREIEQAMQKVMDEYAGGIKTDYRYHEAGLLIAEKEIKRLQKILDTVRVKSHRELLSLYEVRERLIVAEVLIAHLRERKETRWHGFQENADHPEVDPAYRCYINSVYRDGKVKMIHRELIKE